MLQVREKSLSRLLKTHAPVIYIISKLGGIPSYACPLNTVPVKEGFTPSACAMCCYPYFLLQFFLAQCCLRTEFRSSFVQKLAHQTDDLLDQTS